jgi:hypothetical protein
VMGGGAGLDDWLEQACTPVSVTAIAIATAARMNFALRFFDIFPDASCACVGPATRSTSREHNRLRGADPQLEGA